MEINNNRLSAGIEKTEFLKETNVEIRKAPKTENIIKEGIEKEKEKREFSHEDLSEAIEKANKSFKPHNRKLEFNNHDKSNRILVKVIDTNTDEVIREIPPEKIVDMVANMMEIAGIFLDERA